MRRSDIYYIIIGNIVVRQRPGRCPETFAAGRWEPLADSARLLANTTPLTPQAARAMLRTLRTSHKPKRPSA
jgi:hypothetical protein